MTNLFSQTSLTMKATHIPTKQISNLSLHGPESKTWYGICQIVLDVQTLLMATDALNI